MADTGTIIAINLSPAKGTEKRPVEEAVFLDDFGIEGDAHAGRWHRQVSLLSYEKFEEFRQKGAPIEPGAFGENLLIAGFDFRTVPVGTWFQSGDVILEITQIGKECHSGCEIFQKMGECIMPREGVFARVIRGGILHPGDVMTRLAAEQTD